MKRNDFKILIAEDEPSVRRLYERAFQAEGFDVTLVEAGGQMLAELDENKFDLLITDMRLDGMSALEAMPYIRKAHPTMPIVVVSGHYVNLEEDFHRKGFNVTHFFNKPLSFSVLRKTVKGILGIPEEETAKA
jgi:DNA-binding NtrC family response regulator